MNEKFDQLDFCETNVIHYDTINTVRDSMPSVTPISGVADLFKILGDVTRARIICALTIHEMCVCDIAALLEMSSSAISHQLRILKQSGVIKNRRDGKTVLYRLADEHIRQLFTLAFDHVTEERGAAE